MTTVLPPGGASTIWSQPSTSSGSTGQCVAQASGGFARRPTLNRIAASMGSPVMPWPSRPRRTLTLLYGNALRFYAQGRVVSYADEKTGRQILQRASPPQPGQPGKPEKREHAYIRHGGRALLAAFVVPTGPIVWNRGQTRTRADGATHLTTVVHQWPARSRYDWGVDHRTTHWSLDGGRLGAHWGAGPVPPKALHRGAQRRAFRRDPPHKHGFHVTPTQGSWLHPVALWLSALARRWLKRGACCAVADCETRLCAYREVYHTPQAHPYRGTYTGPPLVRATPFRQTRHPQRQGRAWFSPRPKRCARAVSPPRP
jgi:hypothetical protein